jgi:hypothetical protein
MSTSVGKARRRQLAVWIVVIVAWLVLGHAAAIVWAASQAMTAARQVQAAALGVGDLVTVEASSLARLETALVRTQHALRRLQRTAWWAPYLARWDSAPSLHAVGVLLSDGLAAALDLSELAWWTLLEVESGTPGAWHTLPERSVSASVVRSLEKERGRLLSVRERLERVEGALGVLGGERASRLRELATLARLATDLGLVAPQLAGDVPTRVLVVFQNDDEMRPTGGFISSVAELTLKHGQVIEMRFMDSYDVEGHQSVHPPAPPPLARWMDAGMLLFRDANWSPDFRDSAEVMAAIYAADMGREVDAVVAVNASLAVCLLEALGPVPLPGYDVVVTSDNVRDVAATFWAQPLGAPSISAEGDAWSEWLEHRKDVGGALVEGLLVRLGHLDPHDAMALAMTLQQAVERKDLLVWPLSNARMQQDIRRAGLEGGLRQSSGDYLMVVEANVGWNKVNPNVTREVIYRVDLRQEPRAELVITYENGSAPVAVCEHEARYGESYEAMTEGCYWNYVRILVPEGAKLQDTEGLLGDVTVGSLDRKTVFGGLVLVPAGETVTARWSYLLPDRVAAFGAQGDLGYDLLAQRQPGMQQAPLSVVVRAPEMVATPTAPWAMQEDGSWAAGLQWDRDLQLSWTSGR